MDGPQQTTTKSTLNVLEKRRRRGNISLRHKKHDKKSPKSFDLSCCRRRVRLASLYRRRFRSHHLQDSTYYICLDLCSYSFCGLYGPDLTVESLESILNSKLLQEVKPVCFQTTRVY